MLYFTFFFFFYDYANIVNNRCQRSQIGVPACKTERYPTRNKKTDLKQYRQNNDSKATSPK